MLAKLPTMTETIHISRFRATDIPFTRWVQRSVACVARMHAWYVNISLRKICFPVSHVALTPILVLV
jgi:hypothetical protein